MRSLLLVVPLVLSGVGFGWAAPPELRPTEGLRDHTPRVFALTGATIVPAPGQSLANATLVVRDGLVAAVGERVEIPADASVISLAGHVIYPGFIDSFTQQEFPRPEAGEEPQDGVGYWNALITPELAAVRHYRSDERRNADWRSQGFVARLVAPQAGIIRGTSVIVDTGKGTATSSVLSSEAALHVHLYVSRSPRRLTYPNSPMGAVALARQAFWDATWYRDQRPYPLLERNPALATLQRWLPPSEEREARGGTRPPLVMLDADTEQYLLRADQFAREFGLQAVFRGGGREYRRAREVAATGRPVIVPVAFPAPPYVASPDGALIAELDDLMHWDLAPENPLRLERADVDVLLTTHGLDSPASFLKNVRRAVARGWSPASALRALTTTPAELFGMRERLGAIEPGRLASFVVADGDLFTSDARVTETWIRGRRHRVVDGPTADLRGVWRLSTTTGEPREVTIKLSGTFEAPTGHVLAADGPRPLKHLTFRGEQLSFTWTTDGGGRGGGTGEAQLAASVIATDERTIWTGTIGWPDGGRATIQGERVAESDANKTALGKASTSGTAIASDSTPVPAPGTAARAKFEAFAVNYPLGAFGRQDPGPPSRPPVTLFQDGVVWTCGQAGVLKNADVLVIDGKIAIVAADIKPPVGAQVIDLAGRHLTPGLIDPHSHIATDGGVNETGRAIACQVRIADFIDANDVNLYRQLAGGTTTALILHGSACPIGGQGEVIKFRWGLTARELRFDEAPPTVKFALGENVTKGPDILVGRYPHSRMGVEQLHRDALSAARDYRQQWDEWRARRAGNPPRRDLELECLAEVLAGQRWIHCHCYRQDEIVAFLRVLEDFQVRVGCLHHASEGYKVADAMLRHGAMATTFSDWWAFKMETLDAIAHNASFLHRAGIVTSFHSDDRELGRHLNHEAAKAMRYGQLTAEEALKLVTIGPARQLRVDAWVGSIEPGKQADLVVWNQEPVSPFARCDQTWIDGRKYFDREDDLRQRVEMQRRKNILVQKVLASGETMMEAGLDYSTDKESWDREDKYCRGSRERGGGR